METKITNTKIYTKWEMLVNPHPNDIPNEVLVTEGIFLLVECKPDDALFFIPDVGSYKDQIWQTYPGNIVRVDTKRLSGKYYTAIVISQKETFDPDEPVFCLDEIEYGWDEAYLKNGRGEGTCTACSKILAMPKNLSSQHIRMALEGKLKSGNVVLVECEENAATEEDSLKAIGSFGQDPTIKTVTVVKTDVNDHVSLYLVEDKEFKFNKKELEDLIYKAMLDAATNACGPQEFLPHFHEKWVQNNIKK